MTVSNTQAVQRRPNTTIMATNQTIRLATLNCAGINTNKEKRELIFDRAKNLKVDILLMQETNIPNHEEKKIKIEWGVGPCIFSAAQTYQLASGVAIFCGRRDIEIIDPLYDAEGKYIAADFKIRGAKFRVINVHLPSGPTLRTFENALDSIHALMQTNDNNGPIIMGGDFNFVENPHIDRNPPPILGIYGTQRDTVVKPQWDSFKEIYNIRDIAKTRRPVQFTRERDNKFSRLDRVYVTPQVSSTNVLVCPVGVSDHRMVITDLIIGTPKKKGPGRLKCNIKVHERPEFLQDVQDLTANQLDHQNYQNNITAWWKNYKKKLTQLYARHAKIRIRELQEEQKRIEKALEIAENRLLANPHNNILQNEFQNKKIDLKTFLINKTKEKMIKKRYNNFGPNYFTTKEFFRKFKQGQKDSYIDSLKNNEGQEESEPEEILKIAKAFYKNLYKKEQLDPATQQKFLDFVQTKITEEQNTYLNRDLEEEETVKAIKDTKAGGSPGLDAIPIDYYKRFLSIIKTPLTKVLNHYFTTSNIPYDTKLSAITIIYKKDDRKNIKNYRPISLSNNDLKILTKIMCERLKTLMDSIIGDSQYACPGRNIATPNHILRDMYCDAVQHKHEHFIISIDFIKAFDSVDREYMLKVLEKMGFEGRFLDTVKNLNTATGAKLIINGFISDTIKLRRGIKQGDALSLFLFLVALEPLIVAIKMHPQITGIKTPSGIEQKTLCYADDANLTVSTRSSLYHAVKLIHEFGKATGLRVQPAGHQKCCTCLITYSEPTLRIRNLPPDLKYITDGIELLGTAIGNPPFVKQFMGKKVKAFEEEANALRRVTQTIQERATLANSKLQSILTYNAQFHGISDHYKDKINKISRDFVLSKTATCKQYYKTTRTPEYGGMSVPHISKNTECMVLKQIFDYVEHRTKNEPMDTRMSYIESNIGHFISRLCNFTIRNIRHTHPPNYFYQRAKDFINYYNISAEELKANQLKPIRDRIRNGTTLPPLNRRDILPPFRQFRREPQNENMNALQPHHIITFNYKKQNELLPLPKLREEWGPGGTANCFFCSSRRETTDHLFFECERIAPLWYSLGRITERHFEKNEVINMQFNPSIENREIRIVLTSKTAHKIWKNRNNIKHRNITQISLSGMLRELYHSLKNDLTFENLRPRIQYRNQLATLVQNMHRRLVQWQIIEAEREGVT